MKIANDNLLSLKESLISADPLINLSAEGVHKLIILAEELLTYSPLAVLGVIDQDYLEFRQIIIDDLVSAIKNYKIEDEISLLELELNHLRKNK